MVDANLRNPTGKAWFACRCDRTMICPVHKQIIIATWREGAKASIKCLIHRLHLKPGAAKKQIHLVLFSRWGQNWRFYRQVFLLDGPGQGRAGYFILK